MGQHLRLIEGHVMRRLRELPDDSVNCVVTSPPYYRLRAYGTDPQLWGGNPECEHSWGLDIPGSSRGGSGTPTGRNGRGEAKGRFCSLCGAWLGELGSEPSLSLFIEHLVEVFVEVRRVLRPDGVCFVNIGDSYNGTGDRIPNIRPNGDLSYRAGGIGMRVPGLKPKDLCLVPERLAIALQDSGWWVRQRIPWVKRQAMPESAKDRPTCALEMFWMLTKSARYFWNYDAVKVQAAWDPSSTKVPDGWDTGKGSHGTVHRQGRSKGERRDLTVVAVPDAYKGSVPGRKDGPGQERRSTRDRVVDKQAGHGKRHAGFNERYEAQETVSTLRAFRNTDLFFQSIDTPHGAIYDEAGDLIALDVGNQGFKGAHFATFPGKLIEPLILGGCPPDGIVLDPFVGSGTTLDLVAALRLRGIHFNAIGIELLQANIDMATDRIRKTLGVLADSVLAVERR